MNQGRGMNQGGGRNKQDGMNQGRGMSQRNKGYSVRKNTIKEGVGKVGGGAVTAW